MCRLRAQRARLTAEGKRAGPLAPVLSPARTWLIALVLASASPVGAQEPSAATDSGAARRPINNWSELRGALAGCWHPPTGTDGSLIGFRFGLTKSGEIRGKPLVTARQFRGTDEDKRRFSDSAFEALKACFPIPVTASFGAILGESPIRLRFVNTKPEAAYQINSNITVFAPP